MKTRVSLKDLVTDCRKFDEFSKAVVFGQKCILQNRMDQRGDHMKMNFEYFQIQKRKLETQRKT